MDRNKDCSESSTLNQSHDSEHGRKLTIHGTSADETVIGDNENDSDIIVPLGQSSYYVDDSLFYLTKLGSSYYKQTWQYFSKEVWTDEFPKCDAVITRPTSAPSRTCI